MRTVSIAIDGPAASGKSTIGALVAERLGYLYIDTGAMYRAVTWAALEQGVAIADEQAVTALAERLRIDIVSEGPDDGRQYTVLADGVDITWAIRQPAVNDNVSPVSAYRGVRAALVPQQRRIAERGGAVLVGRDIGTVVLPDAQVKIYLDAALPERARRRWAEATARGLQLSLDEVTAELANRDRIDSTRVDSPLSVAADARVIDSTNLSIEEVVAAVLAIVSQRDCCR
ncbi:MAG: (d)CMP kinase [Anaerolineae bacterium]|jgi:cytidylate kinase